MEFWLFSPFPLFEKKFSEIMLFEVEHILVCFMILKKVAITFCSPFGPDIVVFIYKEAYEEFKHVLLAFIYDKDDQASPVANEVRSI